MITEGAIATIVEGKHEGRSAMVMKVNIKRNTAKLHFDHPGSPDCEFDTVPTRFLQ